MKDRIENKLMIISEPTKNKAIALITVSILNLYNPLQLKYKNDNNEYSVTYTYD